MKWGCTYKAEQLTKMYSCTPFPPLIHSWPQLVYTPLSGCACRCGCLPPEKGCEKRVRHLHFIPLHAAQRMQPPLPCTPGLYISQWDELEKPPAVSQESHKQSPDFQIIISALSNSTTLDLMYNHSSAFWCEVVKSPRSPIGELRSTVQDCLLLYLVLHFFQMEDCLHTKYRIFRDQTLLSDLKPTTQPLRTRGPLFLQWRRRLCRRARQPHHSKT